MTAPAVMVLTGTGINCDLETAFAFRRAGARTKIIHVADLMESPQRLFQSQILVLPGGFSYGDHTGSGNALAIRLRHGLATFLRRFVESDRLILGICNGFQVLTHLGLLPGEPAGAPDFTAKLNPEFRATGQDSTSPAPGCATDSRRVALLSNRPPGYVCRWVDLLAEKTTSPWLRDSGALHLPVAHGEGRFWAPPAELARLANAGQLVLRYARDGKPAHGEAPWNPNGAALDVAGVCDPTGRVMGMMPHPERAIDFVQREDWPSIADKLRRQGRELPEAGDGLALFRAAVRYYH